MKKLASCLSLALFFSSVCAEDVTTPTLTPSEEAACERVTSALRDAYISSCLHEQIEAVLQEVANANRDDFETALRVYGVTLEDGSVVWAIPSYFVVK